MDGVSRNRRPSHRGCARSLCALLAVGSSALVTGTARADAGASAEPEQPAVMAPEVEWNEAWARFRPWEYAATGATWAQALIVRFTLSPNSERGTFSIDESITEAVSLSGTAFDVATQIGNVGYLSAIGYRLLDSTVVPGLVWGSGDVALQMTMIDLEAFAISTFVLWNAQLAYGRERPHYRDCPRTAPPDTNCDAEHDNRYRAFIAGHTLVASTAAGLTCVHHRHLPLYGGGLADDLACAGMIGVAAVVGFARLTAQRHYATDTLLAWGIGALAGYVVPSALHYGFGRPAVRPEAVRRRPAPDAVRLTFIPGVGSSTTGATVAGTF